MSPDYDYDTEKKQSDAFRATLSSEVETFLREYDEGKHPLSAEDEAALEAAREDLARRLHAIIHKTKGDA